MALSAALASIDRRQFRFWGALIGAFFSSRVYIDVAKRWRGLALFFLFGLIVFASLPLGLRIEWAIYAYCRDHIIKPLETLPPVLIRDGRVEWTYWMPYRLLDEEGKTVLIVDTTDIVTQIDHQSEPELTWLLTADALHFSPPTLKVTPHLYLPLDNAAHIRRFESEDNGVITASELMTTRAKAIIYMVSFLVYPCVILMLFGILAPILAAFAWAAQYYVRAIFRYTMPYQATYRLLVVSLTAPVVMNFFLATCDLVFENAKLYAFLLFALYFNLGVLAVRRVDRTIVLA